MPRRMVAASIVFVVLAAFSAASAGLPVPEVAGLHPAIPAGPCVAENSYEVATWHDYGEDCKRLHFVFGPITVKPGQNDVLIQPTVIEKPNYPGYIVRFKPDLVDGTGVAPGIETVHLHHATWLEYGRSYGWGPFFASGEEKTIADFPPGYGMFVDPATDFWMLLYMVHNTTPVPQAVWITYDIDYIARAEAQALGIVGVKTIWLDVQHEAIAPGAPSTGGNPVFNVQRGFGHIENDLLTGLPRRVCTWPRENCARFDVYGNSTPQQGQPITLAGADWTAPAAAEGTLIGIGGHLHPGGIRDEVSLVRGGVEKPIHISDATYWQRGANEAIAGGPENSWDFSMGVTGSTLGWKVKIKAGDKLRLNAVYDSETSWYENMGIVVALVAPTNVEREDALHGGRGVDVFDENVVLDPGVPVDATVPQNWLTPSCTPDATSTPRRLCLRGQVTHGHMPEASHFGGCPLSGCTGPDPRLAPDGPMVTDIFSAGFTYGISELGLIQRAGVPRVQAGAPMRFWNYDTALDIWHTFTRCAEPCTGATGLDYPLADGGTATNPSEAAGEVMNFDSTEIGYGVFFSPASGQFGGSKPPDDALRDGLFYEFTPTVPGTYTFFCRIHPSMRGAFRVVE